MAADPSLLARLQPFQLLAKNTLTEASQSAQVMTKSKDTVLFKRGDPRDTALWLLEGEVDLVDENFETQHVTPEQVHMLDQGDVHRYTGIAKVNCQLLGLPRDTLDLIMTVDQATNEESDDDWMTRLLSSRLFEFVPPANIQMLFKKFTGVNYGAGDEVIRQGDSGDYFYVVKTGRASIQRVQGDDKKQLKQIGPGDFFGEDALISNKKRNATVTMLESGELMRLNKQDFNELLVKPASEYVTLSEVQAVIDGGEQDIKFIDVRHPSEIEVEVVAGTKNIPLQLLRQQAAELDQETVYVVATPGRRAELGALLLTQAGFDSYILKTE
ncbi:MAG: cyclic nucleotide-binding domain-containing protein [Pseudomonadales bacterium]